MVLIRKSTFYLIKKNLSVSPMRYIRNAHETGNGEAKERYHARKIGTNKPTLTRTIIIMNFNSVVQKPQNVKEKLAFFLS